MTIKKTKSKKKKAEPKISPNRQKSAGTTACLEFDAAIYKKTALSQAQKAFAGLAAIEIAKSGKVYLVTFKGMGEDVAAQLPDEFANFALGCLVVNR